MSRDRTCDTKQRANGVMSERSIMLFAARRPCMWLGRTFVSSAGCAARSSTDAAYIIAKYFSFVVRVFGYFREIPIPNPNIVS